MQEKRMIPKPPGRVVTIDDDQMLAAFVGRMVRRDWIAVDTEFLRERTYYPKLCLVQVADSQEIGLIDVLAIDDLSPLAALLGQPDLYKVFHSAEQDLEVLYQYFGVMPAPLFDTQIAAALVGRDDQMGYARLIAALLNIDLPKTHTRTDWRQRPLPAAVLDYAADDVRYLTVAYTVLRDELSARGRLDWLDADFDRLCEPARFVVDPGQAWRRLRGWHRLRADQQQVLAELAAWRERRAMTSDRPRKWVLGDEAVMAIARRRPADVQALADIRELPGKILARHGNALLACVECGQAREPRILETRPAPPSERDKRLIRAGMDQLDECAQQAGIAAGVIASRKEVARLVAGERDLRVLSGWRAKAAGHEIVAAIDGAAARLPYDEAE